jgi:hypothetical protein
MRKIGKPKKELRITANLVEVRTVCHTIQIYGINATVTCSVSSPANNVYSRAYVNNQKVNFTADKQVTVFDKQAG